MSPDAGAARTPERRIEVPVERLVQDWKEAHERALAYLAALELPEDERRALADEAVERALAEPWDGATEAVGATLDAARRLVVARHGRGEASDPFVAWRLRTTPFRDGALRAAPELRRRSMASGSSRLTTQHALYGSPLRALRRRLGWTRVARRRRLLLFALVLIPAIVATGFMVNVLPQHGKTWLEVGIIAFFGALFGWISIGFWTALLGFVTLVRGDRFAITSLAPATAEPAVPPDAGARTAVIMPIADEPVARVFAGLRATWASAARAGALDAFHFFILSDTADPATAVREEEAWLDWCREVGGFGRIFYRRRKVRIERKAGNVGDFLRRWGRRYRYMVVLDADSVMSGDTLRRLVEIMDRHADVGMVQTAPVAVNRRSLFARVQQFASRVYGPMFAAGLHFWQLGDGQYWGHNTIIRVEPFMDHCGLPRLPGREPLGGEILSHDFVEAAFMGRAGWTLWLAYDLPGSWEEVPSTLLDEMRRDRRWCQGNLQHLRLLFTAGLFGAHRALFLNGALSYVSALLWNAFLVLSTAEAIWSALREPEYFPHGPSLFPEWPVWRPEWAYSLITVIALILFLPKLLSIVLITLKRRDARAYGGVGRLTLSVVLEILLSSLLAPIRMVFHSRFVMLNLLGRTVGWRSQARGDDQTTWGDALRQHWLDMVMASAWGATLLWLNPHYFFWVAPIIVALVIAVPISVFTSRASVGERLRRWGLFLIPEESAPPPELRELVANWAAGEERVARLPPAERDGFVRAAVDPTVNALHRVLLRGRRRLRASIRAARRELLERALAAGPASLTTRERRILLHDPEMTDELHRRVWALPERAEAARWGRPGTPPPRPAP